MKDLFTVCITHYNQMDYIFTAIDSVLRQDYPNIELFIADDGSKSFDRNKVIKYINGNKKDNIQDVIVPKSERNVGTVKNLNSVLKKAKGKYIMFFAADDELSNSMVVSNFKKAFDKNKKLVITAQAYMYDNELRVNNGPYVDVKTALRYNNMDPIDVFVPMAKKCFYASGATAYDMEVFMKHGLFDERYLLVEDWSYYLHLLKNNEKIFFQPFDALNHRDGGISHFDKITSSVKKYHEDILKIYEYELLRDMPKIDKKLMLELYNKCKMDIPYICDLIKLDKIDYYNNLIKWSIKENIGNGCTLFMITFPKRIGDFFRWHVYYKFRFLNRDYHLFIITFLYWILINCTFMKDYYANSSNGILYLLISLVLSGFIANLFVGIGDMMEYCVPLALYSFYRLDILNRLDIFKSMIVFIIIYFIIYYILYILRIIYNNIKKL